MKKIVIVVVLAAILATGTAFADPRPNGLGIGITGGYRGGWGGDHYPGWALALKLPSFAPYLGIDLDIYNNNFSIGLTADWNFVGGDFAPILGWYIDLGGYFGLSAYDKNSYLNLGARLPIGLTIKPIQILDIFIAIVPSLGLGFRVSGSSDDGYFHFPAGGWGGNLGIRVWL